MLKTWKWVNSKAATLTPERTTRKTDSSKIMKKSKLTLTMKIQTIQRMWTLCMRMKMRKNHQNSCSRNKRTSRDLIRKGSPLVKTISNNPTMQLWTNQASQGEVWSQPTKKMTMTNKNIMMRRRKKNFKMLTHNMSRKMRKRIVHSLQKT